MQEVFSSFSSCNETDRCDVAIIGGGPAGSTVGALIKKYGPGLDVAIFERETFPREHVGESLLPSACKVLAEMGCWDDVERADFPVKISATYRWGTSRDLWDFEFVPSADFKEEPRPARYEGQRASTAFQVDRAIFDKILLDRARGLGCRVYEQTKVSKVESDADRVTRLEVEGGRGMIAKHYIDASGSSGTLRRALGVEVQEPTALKNVAFWDYWTDTDWAVSIGTTATRVLVLSLSWGWIWFIPLGPTRTSIGLVCPASYYKSAGLSPEELYETAISSEPKIRELTKNASREGQVRGTKDWSFVADRLTGDNWFLVGETAGFADPILAAGVSLTLSGARELAFTILALEQGKEDPLWLRSNYDQNQRARIGQHIRFADFWYSANGQFSDLKEFTRQIASDAGLELNAEQAFQWLGTGGFTTDVSLLPTIADVSVSGVKLIAQRLTDTDAKWALEGASVVRLMMRGAVESFRPLYREGRVEKLRVFERGSKVLPCYGFYGIVLEALMHESILERVAQRLVARSGKGPRDPLPFLYQVLEVWIRDGWIEAIRDARYPAYTPDPDRESASIHRNRDIGPAFDQT